MIKAPQNPAHSTALALSQKPTADKLEELASSLLNAKGITSHKFRQNSAAGAKKGISNWTPQAIQSREILLKLAEILTRLDTLSSEPVQYLCRFIRSKIDTLMSAEAYQEQYAQDSLISTLIQIREHEPDAISSLKLEFTKAYLRHAFIRACEKGSYTDLISIRKLPLNTGAPETVETIDERRNERSLRFTFIESVGLVVDENLAVQQSPASMVKIMTGNEICLPLHWDASVGNVTPVATLLQNRLDGEPAKLARLISTALNQSSLLPGSGQTALPDWAQAYRAEALIHLSEFLIADPS